MRVRDAVEADAGALARIADAPRDVMRNLVHDRAVRVAVEVGEGDGGADNEAGTDERDDGAGDETGADERDGEAGDETGADERDDGDGDETGADERDGRADERIRGFVSFDARNGTVHVTQFGGARDACERVLAEPRRFAEREGMDVEVVVQADDDELRAAAEAAGFERAGAGPRFQGSETVRFRLDP